MESASHSKALKLVVQRLTSVSPQQSKLGDIWRELPAIVAVKTLCDTCKELRAAGNAAEFMGDAQFSAHEMLEEIRMSNPDAFWGPPPKRARRDCPAAVADRIAERAGYFQPERDFALEMELEEHRRLDLEILGDNW